ncbi:MAG: hypothetical protein Ta2E_06370 [Mycoplasmoidaceae bacterium]|nr:MAG: hypothetical protein Ta2E_06370 [Mycoplasmoidaceae bacterium]
MKITFSKVSLGLITIFAITGAMVPVLLNTSCSEKKTATLTTVFNKTYEITDTDQDFSDKLSVAGGFETWIMVNTSRGPEPILKTNILGITFANDGTLKNIGDNFLEQCKSFDQPLLIPDSVESIGQRFLYECISFNQSIKLPESITSIGGLFLYDCVRMISTIDIQTIPATSFVESNFSFATLDNSNPCYTHGITISGNDRENMLNRFPKLTSSTYRNLI